VRLVSEVLRAVGYQVLIAGDGEAALEKVSLEQPDLVLLDVLLPGSMNGYEICRRLREFSLVPIIMLTSKARDTDILTGFDAGADDYLTKPFNAKELLARVKAVLRRSQRPEEISTSVFACGELQIDYARHAVTQHGQTVSLTRTEYALLRELAINANRVMSHPDLLTAVWGPEYRDELDYLRAYVRYLRRKIESDPADPQYIVTLPGIGYMLACPEEGEDPA
jgi:two-component system, OmpR family, KDP operon response regulator KdpE